MGFCFHVGMMQEKPKVSIPFYSHTEGGWFYYAGWDRGYHGPFTTKKTANDDYDIQHETVVLQKQSDVV